MIDRLAQPIERERAMMITVTSPAGPTVETTTPTTKHQDNTDTAIYAAAGILVILAVLLIMILIPIVIIHNKKRRRRRDFMKYRASQRQNTSEVTSSRAQGGEVIVTDINKINNSLSQIASDGETEAKGTNHFYDDLSNYNAQTSRPDGGRGQTERKGKDISDVEQAETEHKLPILHFGGSDTVLEDLPPPVPERTYKINTQADNTTPLTQQEYGDGRHPRQNKVLGKEEASRTKNPDAVGTTACSNIRRENKDRAHTFTTQRNARSCDMSEHVDSVTESPDNHTYSKLEGAQVFMHRRHKTHSLFERKRRNTDKAKGSSQAEGGYNTLDYIIEKKGESKRQEGERIECDSKIDMEVEDPSDHHYAVLEGPTPIEESGDEMPHIKRDWSFMTDKEAGVGTTNSGYDRLAPKNVQINKSLQENTADLCFNVCTTSTSMSTNYDGSVPDLEGGHMYETLGLDDNGKKKKKEKKSSKKKSKRLLKRQTSAKKDTARSSCTSMHDYDMVDLCSKKSAQETSGMDSHDKASTRRERINFSTPRHRRITHSMSSRTLCDVTEVRNRSLTTHTAASDTHLNRIDPDLEAHIYDTVGFLPVTKRKRKRSGKRYKWLHLMEKAKRQEMMATDETAPNHETSTHSVSSCHAAEPSDPSCGTSEYASLDMSQTYLQVGPFVPGEKLKEASNEDSSDYAHLKH